MPSKIPLLTAPLFAVLLLSACASPADTQTPSTDKSSTMTQATETDNPQLAPPVAGEKIAAIETTMGTIKVKLFSEQVPETVKNFEELSKDGKYNDVPFHRVIKNFMIQTGDFNKKDGTGGYSYKGPGTMFDDEIEPSLKNIYGAVSMANKGPDTNGSQFFIITDKNGRSYLNGKHAVFGQVYEGMDIAEKIAALQGPGDAPTTPVSIVKVTVSTYSGE